MRYIKATIFLLCICGLAWADFFPIGGYGCERLRQADSCQMLNFQNEFIDN